MNRTAIRIAALFAASRSPAPPPRRHQLSVSRSAHGRRLDAASRGEESSRLAMEAADPRLPLARHASPPPLRRSCLAERRAVRARAQADGDGHRRDRAHRRPRRERRRRRRRGDLPRARSRPDRQRAGRAACATRCVPHDIVVARHPRPRPTSWSRARAARSRAKDSRPAWCARSPASQRNADANDLAVSFDNEVRTLHIEPSAELRHRPRSPSIRARGRFDVMFELPGGASRRPVLR